jgi:hypothetical protein
MWVLSPRTVFSHERFEVKAHGLPSAKSLKSGQRAALESTRWLFLFTHFQKRQALANSKHQRLNYNKTLPIQESERIKPHCQNLVKDGSETMR